MDVELWLCSRSWCADQRLSCSLSTGPARAHVPVSTCRARVAPARRLNMKATPTERIAGIAFFFFVLIQVPFFVVDTPLSAHGLVLLSPLQVTAANLARNFPDFDEAVELLLVPGGWLRDSLSPYLRCQFQTSGRGPCASYAAKLHDLAHVKRSNNLKLLVNILNNNGVAYQGPILYGSTMIVVSALFSVYYTVKTAIVGFAVLGYGVVQGNHTPLPPAVLMAYLVVYAGFNLEGVRGNNRQQRRQQQGAAPGSSRAADNSTSSSAKAGASAKKSQGTPGKTPSVKQRRQKKQA